MQAEMMNLPLDTIDERMRYLDAHDIAQFSATNKGINTEPVLHDRQSLRHATVTAQRRTNLDKDPNHVGFNTRGSYLAWFEGSRRCTACVQWFACSRRKNPTLLPRYRSRVLTGNTRETFFLVALSSAISSMQAGTPNTNISMWLLGTIRGYGCDGSQATSHTSPATPFLICYMSRQSQQSQP